MANIQYSVATTIQSTLRNSVTLTSSDNEVNAIASAAIVVRKMALREREYEVGHEAEAKPGILIVPTKWRSPPEAGNDQKDDVYYVRWNYSTGVWIGVGILHDGDTLSVGWDRERIGGNLGVSVFKIQKGEKGPTLVSKWANYGGNKFGNETLLWHQKKD